MVASRPSLLLSLSIACLAAAPPATAAPGLRGDATVLGGVTSSAGDSRAGVRFVEVGVSPADGARVWGQYDDALSLDSAALSRAGDRVPSWYAGGLLAWGGRFISRLEAGYRRLDGGVDQALVRGEQVLVAGPALALKLGGWAGPRDDGRTEAIAHAGASVRTGALTWEPALFYARSGLRREEEVRGALGATWRLPAGAELGAVVAAGRAYAPSAAPAGDLASALARASLPVRSARLHLQVGREWPASGPATTLAVAGATFTAGGRP